MDDLPDQLQQLHAYWNSKRHGRRMPSREDIDPAEIKALLPIILLTDVLGPDENPRFRYRLVGTYIVQNFGMELTGRYVDEVLKGPYGEALLEVYRAIVRRRQPFFARSKVRTSGDLERLGSSRLMMPLSADGERVNMVFTGQLYDFDARKAGKTLWMIHDSADSVVEVEADPVLLADYL